MPDYDAVVIGSGAGGAAAALGLARRGWRVLVVERGPVVHEPHQDDLRLVVQREASYPEPLRTSSGALRPLLGSVVGGSTALYGAVMLRPLPADLEPDCHYPGVLPAGVGRWPIDYGELVPHLDEAEALFRVAGPERLPAPLVAPRSPRPPLPLAPINQRLRTAFERAGMAPFQMPVAIDRDRCARCPRCPAYHCPTGARVSSGAACLDAALALGAELWTGARAHRLLLDGRRARAVELELAGGVTREVRADHVVVAAGALMTPALLLRSGVVDASGQLGRNFMFHLGALAVAVFARPTEGGTRYIKQLGLADYYLESPRFAHKVGLVQAIPLPGPAGLADKLGLPLPAPLGRWIWNHAAAFAAMVEDLPQPGNRVSLLPSGQPLLEHRFHPYDRFRARHALAGVRRALAHAGPLHVVGMVAERDLAHLAHQVGTCRFGNDPRTSVLDRHCRLHAYDNVHVADGSFMPTSLGVGPALAIAANALRVAAQLTGEVR